MSHPTHVPTEGRLYTLSYRVGARFHQVLQQGLLTMVCAGSRQQITDPSNNNPPTNEVALTISLDLNDALLAQATALATKEQTTLARLIEDGLKLRLRASQPDPAKKRPPLRPFQGKGGTMSGLSSLDNRAMRQAANHDA